ncbi:MAG: sodium:solute symporter family protein, partial [Bacteroidetes bacterium]|nr:sodium:solute symporter family protein [Bacteroidota bacterium]
WLGFLWRRLTKTAVIIQASVCLLIYAVIPNLFPSIEAITTREAFTVETVGKTVMIETKALQADVENGQAAFVGETMKKEHVVLPVGIFFEQVVRENPKDSDSPKIGQGRFQAEIWVVSWLGIDFSRWSKAQLVALRFFFSALFPFLLLFLISAFTKEVPRNVTNAFFAKMHTPVQASDEMEKEELEISYNNPDRFKHRKMFPNTKWEMLKLKKIDYLGFFGSWVLVGIIILLLWIVVTIK